MRFFSIRCSGLGAPTWGHSLFVQHRKNLSQTYVGVSDVVARPTDRPTGQPAANDATIESACESFD